ncbi:hypothetical protein SETIT_3G113500v2 [Setaria italica]|uniref:Uncharacterized protein n=1 Tax=Setaria italica TaxID=4555 RepID=A0A368QDR6_SETIT|nr:hypothetical protein SETIT_3G113500v2 [Setaria italica]
MTPPGHLGRLAPNQPASLACPIRSLLPLTSSAPVLHLRYRPRELLCCHARISSTLPRSILAVQAAPNPSPRAINPPFPTVPNLAVALGFPPILSWNRGGREREKAPGKEKEGGSHEEKAAANWRGSAAPRTPPRRRRHATSSSFHATGGRRTPLPPGNAACRGRGHRARARDVARGRVRHAAAETRSCARAPSRFCSFVLRTQPLSRGMQVAVAVHRRLPPPPPRPRNVEDTEMSQDPELYEDHYKEEDHSGTAREFAGYESDFDNNFDGWYD